MLEMKATHATGALLGVVAGLAISSVHCGPAAIEDRRVRRVMAGADAMIAAVQAGDVDSARVEFARTRNLLHEIAADVEGTGNADAELLHDISYVVEMELMADEPDVGQLVQLLERMSEMFEAASFYLPA